MQALKIAAFLLVFLALSWAQTGAPADTPRQNDLRFNAGLLDKNLDPCADFYAYSCGKWRAQNPVPGDRASWGRFDQLQEQGEYLQRTILEKYSANDPKRSASEQKIGDYYSSCMDESAIEAAGLKPLQGEFSSIQALHSRQEFAQQVVRLQREGIGVLFGFGSDQDYKDATQVIAEADQGGMALPDRDYYLKEDAQSVELRRQYLVHVQNMFALLGDSPATAASEAKSVMGIETALAKGALDLTSRRDPKNTYHRMGTQQLLALSPAFDWNAYLQGTGAPSTQVLNVTEPDFFRHLDGALNTISLDDWKIYLRWHLLHANAALLPAKFRNENFDFFGKKLYGTREPAPRWKRCVRATNGDLGEALGQKYVEATFGADGKQRMLKMVQSLERSLGDDIDHLSWMSPETKKQARIKLAAISNRIGYPDQWRDYGALRITRADAIGNSLRANQFEFERQLNKIGRPVDRNDWPYPPQTVDASYNPQLNNVTFPAGILQPPFFDKQADDAMNFGSIGGAIGHELTHGFDDEGSQFDAQGNLRDWWTEQDKKEFEKRTQCVADEYSGFTVVGDVKLNGRLSLGENVADNGGMRVAYMAWLSTLAGKQPAPVEGLTAQQRFFLGWANVWCENDTDESLRAGAQTDPHSTAQARINGVMVNMPEFREAYHCRADAPMVSKNACGVW
jgi:putative endopeptidase